MARPMPPLLATAPDPGGRRPLKAAGRRGRAPRKAGSPLTAALRALVEDSDQGMILADAQGIITYANAASEALLGYPPAELIGRLGFDLCREEHLPRAREAFSRCLARPGQPVRLTVHVALRGGGVRNLDVTLVNRIPTRGVNAVVVHFREAAGLPGGEAEDAFRVLFEKAPLGLGVAALDGTLLAFNEAILEPGGYTREDVIRLGNVARLYDSPGDRERVLRIARERGFVWREMVPFRRKDGSTYDTLLSLTPVRFRGEACWFAAVEDISEQTRARTQRLELEAQLRQAQKMEAVGRMTGGIAHDFNNILSVILANAEMIASALGSEAGEVGEDLAEVRAAAQRGAAMIRKLLGFSRRADLTTAPTDLSDLVVRVQGMVRHLIEGDVVLEVGTAEDCIARCDPGAVEQMVLNLVTNARDAMPRGGTVRIAVSPAVVDRDAAVRPSWLPPGEFVRLSVADTGSGMDETTRARALEPFFTTKPPGVGTGLGLSMVYGLVKQQDGFLDLISEPGKGTTVHLYFPRAAGAPRERRVTPPRARATRERVTILLLEDDEGLRRAGRRVLEHLGYSVLVAGDGREGLALFHARQAEIDLVISDMVMPGLTGAQVYEEIQRQRPDFPFLLSSGYQERFDRTLEVPPGVRVVPKPWTIEELADVVREALGEAPI